MHSLVWPSVLVWAVMCDVSAQPCQLGEFECRTGECVSEKYLCDFSRDCLDGSDEKNCKYQTSLYHLALSFFFFCFDVFCYLFFDVLTANLKRA